MSDRIHIKPLEDIRQAPYGILYKGEVRSVERPFGLFAIANGWAEHQPAEGEELIPLGERGSCDYHDPDTWTPDAPRKSRGVIQPKDIILKPSA